jgi:hypothetical protein
VAERRCAGVERHGVANRIVLFVAAEWCAVRVASPNAYSTLQNSRVRGELRYHESSSAPFLCVSARSCRGLVSLPISTTEKTHETQDIGLGL